MGGREGGLASVFSYCKFALLSQNSFAFHDCHSMTVSYSWQRFSCLKVWDKGSGLEDAIAEERKGFNQGDDKNMKDM